MGGHGYAIRPVTAVSSAAKSSRQGPTAETNQGDCHNKLSLKMFQNGLFWPCGCCPELNVSVFFGETISKSGLWDKTSALAQQSSCSAHNEFRPLAFSPPVVPCVRFGIISISADLQRVRKTQVNIRLNLATREVNVQSGTTGSFKLFETSKQSTYFHVVRQRRGMEVRVQPSAGLRVLKANGCAVLHCLTLVAVLC